MQLPLVATAGAVDRAVLPLASGGFEELRKIRFCTGRQDPGGRRIRAGRDRRLPAQWNTNSTGELVNVEGRDGKWLSLWDGVFLPEFITALPENFTLEFDLICNDDFSFYSTAFSVNLCRLAAQKDAFNIWNNMANSKTVTAFRSVSIRRMPVAGQAARITSRTTKAAS